MGIMNAHSVNIKQSAVKVFLKVSNKKIGIYSGTFDPIHVGHVEFALTAAEMFNLEKVILLPEKSPRQKENSTTLETRLALLDIATADYKNLDVVVLPVERFTVSQTLPLVVAMNPDARLVFLCGSDVAKTFLYRWEGLKQLLESVDVVVSLRSGDTKESITAIFTELERKEAMTIRYDIIKSPKHYLASTHIRSGNHRIDDIDPKVAVYILENKLYASLERSEKA